MVKKKKFGQHTFCKCKVNVAKKRDYNLKKKNAKLVLYLIEKTLHFNFLLLNYEIRICFQLNFIIIGETSLWSRINKKACTS